MEGIEKEEMSTQEVRERYSKELHDIRNAIYQMSMLCIDQMKKGIQVVENNKRDIVDDLLAQDSTINIMEQEIIDSCVKFIALEQPVASDLREIISAIKFISNMGRIGDHARHIVEKDFSKFSRKKFFPEIRKMAEIGITMLDKSMESYLHREKRIAVDLIITQEKLIRKLKKQFNKTVLAYMQTHPESMEEGRNLLFLARFMERFGDHARNICEWVYFAKTGKHYK